jgi:CRP-like cAMP-binding protein
MAAAASASGPLERVTAHFPLVADLPPPLRDRLARELRVTAAPRGTRLFDEHSPCGAFPLMLEGRVRVVKLAPSGREILLYRVEEGQSCVLSGGACSAMSIALPPESPNPTSRSHSCRSRSSTRGSRGIRTCPPERSRA